MNTKRKVTEREVRRWITWLKTQGYGPPFSGVNATHQYVKLLVRELKKEPPTILDTCPRDKRTVTKNLNHFGPQIEKRSRSFQGHTATETSDVVSGREIMYLQGGPSAKRWRLKTVPLVAFD